MAIGSPSLRYPTAVYTVQFIPSLDCPFSPLSYTPASLCDGGLGPNPCPLRYVVRQRHPDRFHSRLDHPADRKSAPPFDRLRPHVRKLRDLTPLFVQLLHSRPLHPGQIFPHRRAFQHPLHSPRPTSRTTLPPVPAPPAVALPGCKHLVGQPVMLPLSDQHQLLPCRTNQLLPTRSPAKRRCPKLSRRTVARTRSGFPRTVPLPRRNQLDVSRTGLLHIAARRISAVRDYLLRLLSRVLLHLLHRSEERRVGK